MKKSLLPLLALALVMGLLAGLYRLTRPAGLDGEKAITVQVVYKDQSQADFTYRTHEEFLAPVLTESGLVTGETGPYGIYILEVDGQRADFNLDKAYWALFIDEEYATTGIDSTPIHDGDVFRLVYTLG